MINRKLRSTSAKVGRISLVIGVVLLVALALSGVHVGQADGPYPPAKARLIALQRQELATARAHPRNKPPKNAPLPPYLATWQPLPTPQAGIFATHQGPFAPINFTIRNAWQGPVGSVWETVYAGGTPKDPNSGSSTPGPGALRIYIDHPDGSFDFVKTVMAPNGSGPLTITAVNGTTMQFHTDAGNTLADAGGNPLTFDLQKEQFTNGLQGEATTLK
jgi:hypothetical protein